MKKQNIKFASIFTASISLSVLSPVLFSAESSGIDIGIDARLIAFIAIPFVFLMVSTIFDVQAMKAKSNEKHRIETMLFLPLMISFHFILLTGSTMIFFANTTFWMYFLLFLPLLFVLLFAGFYKSYSISKMSMLVIVKYCFTILLYAYSYFIWLSYA